MYFSKKTSKGLQQKLFLFASVKVLQKMIKNAFYFGLQAPFTLKDGLSVLRQILATESPLKMLKNIFYFILKALFVLKVFKFLS